MSTDKVLMDTFNEAQEFIHENLVELCSNLINRQDGKYDSIFQTKFFELVEMLAPIGVGTQSLAEIMIKNAAMRFVIDNFED